jgi:hypothetical protein
MQKIRSTCRERRISSRARCFSPRCSWQPGLNNPRSHRTRLVRFPMLSRQKVHRPQRSPRSLIPKKMFEQSVTETYLMCCDTSAFPKRGRPRTPKQTPNMKASMRCAGVAIAICSWVAISNHCAFAAVTSEIDKAQTECPFHSTPAKQKQEPSQLQCCKILRAVVFAQTKSWARDDAKSFDVDLRVEDVTLVALLPNVQASSSLDTGPPGARSFAELILQRSLLAHAPPFRA